MVDGSAIKEIKEIIESAQPSLKIGKDEYIRGGFKKVTPPRIEGSTALPTLEGLVRFAKLKSKYPRTVCVVSPKAIAVTEFDEENQKDITVAECTLDLEEFRYNQYMPMDAFRINLLTKFVESKDREALIRYISKITEKSETRLEDDGVTINTTIEVGTSGASMELQSFSSELNLKPRRTFPDIDQPETKLLFRMKSKNEMALFDFSDGTWINQACADLHTFMSEKLEGMAVI